VERVILRSLHRLSLLPDMHNKGDSMKNLIVITALLAICCGSASAGWSPWSWSFKWGQGQSHKGSMSSIGLSLSLHSPLISESGTNQPLSSLAMLLTLNNPALVGSGSAAPSSVSVALSSNSPVASMSGASNINLSSISLLLQNNLPVASQSGSTNVTLGSIAMSFTLAPVAEASNLTMGSVAGSFALNNIVASGSGGSTFTDNFAYSLGNLQTVSGGIWVTPSYASAIAVVSGGVTGTSNGTDNIAYYSSWSYGNDQCSSVVTGSQSAPAVRISSSATNNRYTTSAGGVYKFLSGSYTQIGSFSSPTNGDTVKLCAIGTTLTIYVNGTLATTITGQTDITTGYPGMDITTVGTPISSVTVSTN
jgi:hypothetical protein